MRDRLCILKRRLFHKATPGQPPTYTPDHLAQSRDPNTPKTPLTSKQASVSSTRGNERFCNRIDVFPDGKADGTSRARPREGSSDASDIRKHAGGREFGRKRLPPLERLVEFNIERQDLAVFGLNSEPRDVPILSRPIAVMLMRAGDRASCVEVLRAVRYRLHPSEAFTIAERPFHKALLPVADCTGELTRR